MASSSVAGTVAALLYHSNWDFLSLHCAFHVIEKKAHNSHSQRMIFKSSVIANQFQSPLHPERPNRAYPKIDSSEQSPELLLASA